MQLGTSAPLAYDDPVNVLLVLVADLMREDIRMDEPIFLSWRINNVGSK